jgi:hypothetical protein
MINLAGKYASNMVNAIGRRPIPSTLAGAALAGGLATAGNIVTGEAQEEGPGRLVAEALGAGALGGLVGRRIATARAGAGGAKNAQTLYGMKRAMARNLANKGAGTMATGAGVEIGNAANREKLRQEVRSAMAGMNIGYGAGAGVGLLGAGALGGMVGGGVSNVGNLVGISGFNQNVIADPENTIIQGSSNTQMARMSTPTLRYIG